MIPRERLIETARRVYRSYGYSPIDTPALEYLEILLGKGGAETDKQLYRFEDHHAGGWHRGDGILLAAGAGIRQTDQWLAPPTLLDIVPTALRLMGYQPPAQLDGRILDELLLPSPVPSRPLSPPTTTSAASRHLSNAEQDELKRRLQGLGYMD